MPIEIPTLTGILYVCRNLYRTLRLQGSVVPREVPYAYWHILCLWEYPMSVEQVSSCKALISLAHLFSSPVLLLQNLRPQERIAPAYSKLIALGMLSTGF
jgi:hypothetical protein